MRPVCSLLVLSAVLTTASAQTVLHSLDGKIGEVLQRSVVRIWWNRDLMATGEFLRFAVNGTVIPNIAPHFYATYETDAWVYDNSGRVVAYLGPAGTWMRRGSLQLVVQTADGQNLPARLVGIDESQGIAVVQTVPDSLGPVAVRTNMDWKTYSGFYVASLEKGFKLIGCKLLAMEKRPGLGEYRFHFKRLRFGRPGSLVFTHDGAFAGFLTTRLKGVVPTRSSTVNMMPAERVVASVQRIIRAGTDLKSGWLGVYFKHEPDTQKDRTHAGVVVRKVVPGGPADKAGIIKKDVVLKVDGVPAESLFQVVRMIQGAPVGSQLRLDLLREGRILQLQPTIGQREDLEREPTYIVEVPGAEKNAVRIRRADGPETAKGHDIIFLGLYLSDAAALPRTGGVVITDVMENTPAAQAGLRKGDVILEINGAIVRNMDQYMEVLTKNLSARRILFRCLRDQSEIEKTIALR
ncbi:MAG: PDZ domain-containing protein [Acidobacteria bacterium]|nr:PDZ domain-containing protein [Acidobacteriota bacterium]